MTTRCILAASTLFVVAGSAAAQTSLQTRARFTDRSGASLWATFLENDYWEYDANEPGNGANDFLGTDTTNHFGVSGFTTDQAFNEGGQIEFYGLLRTRGPWGQVKPWAGAVYHLDWPPGFSAVTVPIRTSGGYDIPALATDTDAGRAFSASQPVAFMHNFYSAAGFGLTMRPVTVTLDSDAHFVNGVNKNTSAYYSHRTSTINVDPSAWFNWDIIMHEYGHHVAEIAGIAPHERGTGGTHSAGIDNIQSGRVLGNEIGSKIAWSEGVATTLGMMANQAGDIRGFFAGDGGAMINAGDADPIYDDFNTPAGTSGLSLDWENRAGSNPSYLTGGAGEGDEMSVGRALFDFYDTNNESYGNNRADRLGFGAENAFTRIIRGPAHAQGVYNRTFRDAWLDLSDELASPEGRARAGLADTIGRNEAMALAGETLAEYNIATTGTFSGDTFDQTPTFEFFPSNGGNSDFFQILVFSTSWDLVYSSGQRGKQNQQMWRFTIPGEDRLPTDASYYWLVLNSPAWADGLSLDRPEDIYNYYWGGANRFTVLGNLPAPGALAVMLLAGLAPRRRRA